MASGASPAAVQVQVQQLKEFKEQYENPLFNSLMTFIEPFPIGHLSAADTQPDGEHDDDNEQVQQQQGRNRHASSCP